MNNIQLFSKKHYMFIALVAFFAGGIAGAVFGSVSSIIVKNGSVLVEQLSGGKDISSMPEVIYDGDESAVIDTVEKTNPAVVSIVIKKNLLSYYSSTGPFFFDFPFEQPQSATSALQQIGGGSGFIIDEDGLIVTNKHVVGDTDAVYTVILSNGKEYDAKVVAKDPVSDIALIKIEATDLPTLPLGDSDQLRIGQTVIAIGYTLAEYGNTVTRGVVSGIGRRVVAGGRGNSEVLEEAIQTDAAINPGNSGGPLLDLSGRVIGINTAISSHGQLIGFAIPINSVKQTIESVQKEGRIIRPWIGVRYVLVTPRIAEINKLPVQHGALIIRGDDYNAVAVVPGSPAAKAGLLEQDIILDMNGQTIDETHTLSKELGKYEVGDTVRLTILRNGEKKEMKIVLAEFPNP
ncbi:MAG TPA: trypsin-like peptidase domain-containing protein [Candidatus Kapabacteria bacterium]|nr:trypsin-like peptidase domain-containing protein [Candidatus Kapabacteria bacterium]